MTQHLGNSLARARSRDGTEIGYYVSGEGPPLIVVHGVLSDHTRWAPLLPFLEPHRTVHAMDRRGRGASGDHPEYALARELEDIAAVVDAVAAASGRPVDLFGHSSGGAFVLRAVMLTPNVRRLIVFEPAISGVHLFPEGLSQRLEGLLARGEREVAVETFVREVLHATDEQLVAWKRQPSWPARVAAAHTLPREVAIPPERLFDADAAAQIAVPTLIMQGSETPPGFKIDVETVAGAVPDARVVTLDGQGHSGDIFAPEAAAAALLAFVRERT